MFNRKSMIIFFTITIRIQFFFLNYKMKQNKKELSFEASKQYEVRENEYEAALSVPRPQINGENFRSLSLSYYCFPLYL